MNRSLTGLLTTAAVLSLLVGFLGQELEALRRPPVEVRAPAARFPRESRSTGTPEPSAGPVEPGAPGEPGGREPFLRLAGEFEPQSALLLTCRELVSQLPGVFAEIVSAASGRIAVIVLVSDDAEREFVFSILDDHGLARDSVECVEAGHNTMWIRDYGPVVARATDGSRVVLDAEYADDERQDDDRVPARIARFLGLRRVRVPVEVDGGNLLTNGDGICLSTVQLFAENDAPAPDVRRALELYYGCETVIVLEPLRGEETGHVDMFATFTSPHTVVVGSYDPGVDPENAALLDRNALALGEAQTRRGPLRVVRVPMPARLHDEWRTYTNVIYANGRLMIPVHSDDDPRDRERVIATYSSLLPGWEMITIDVDDLVGNGGALHCVSRNVDYAEHDRPSGTRLEPESGEPPGESGALTPR